MGQQHQLIQILLLIHPDSLISRVVLIRAAQIGGAGSQRTVQQQLQIAHAVPAIPISCTLTLVQQFLQQGKTSSLYFLPNADMELALIPKGFYRFQESFHGNRYQIIRMNRCV